MTRVGDDPGWERAFTVQAESCDAMGAPFNARVCRHLLSLLDDGTALGRRILGWPRENRGGDLVPLRCCAGFHALARAGQVEALAHAYPPHHVDDATLRAALSATIAAQDAFLTRYLDSPPQTNEIGRSAILLGGLLTIAKQVRHPIALHEIGASAGLNMCFDHWGYDLGAAGSWGPVDAQVRLACPWTGAAPSTSTALSITSRAACDLNPLDPASPTDRARLLSYIWPDQSERLSRTEHAFEVAATHGIQVERADARAWVARVLSADEARANTTSVLFNSIFIQYLDPPTRAGLIADIAARGAVATADRPFAWLAMEADPVDRTRCELRLTLWPGGETVRLAYVDWHGRRAHWD